MSVALGTQQIGRRRLRTVRGKAGGWVLTLMTAALFSACAPRPSTLVLDLAATAAAADRAASDELWLAGSPWARSRFHKGFLAASGSLDDGDPVLWSRLESEVLWHWSQTMPRLALLDLAPAPGVSAQTLQVSLNDREIGRVVVNVGRARYLVELPPDAQRAGENRIRLRFSAQAPTRLSRRRVAAAVFGIAIGPRHNDYLQELLTPGAPPLVSVEAGPRRLIQVGPSTLSFAFRGTRDATVWIHPRLHGAAVARGGAAVVNVTVQTGERTTRQVWNGRLDAGHPEQTAMALPLKMRPGEVARIELQVRSDAGARFAWVEWEGPRITGRGAMESADSQPRAAETLLGSLRRPNVLLIVLDAARARSIGCYGHTRGVTPEIDRIAAEGVTFAQAYSQAVYTVAAMASLWTSRYPDEHGGGIEEGTALPRDPVTLAECLSQHRIANAGFVANAVAGPAFGLDRGFAHFEEVFRGRDRRRDAEAFRETLWRWLEARPTEPFFAYAHFREPHGPYTPPPPFDTVLGAGGPLDGVIVDDFVGEVNWRGRQPTPDELDHLARLYHGNLAFADSEIGALRRRMEALGLWERTLVIVTADHGEALYEHRYIGHNRQVFEESVHVPLVLRFPKGRGRGRRVQALVELIDLAPTIAEVLGVEPPRGERAFRGRSLLPVILGASGKREVFSRTTGAPAVYAVRDADWSFCRDTARDRERLFDRIADPTEKRNLAADKSLLAAYYRQQLGRWLLGQRRSESDSASAKLTPEQQKNLKALGYVQ